MPAAGDTGESRGRRAAVCFRFCQRRRFGTCGFILTGRKIGMKTRTSIQICYEDTDAGGVVYHSKYLGFAERARMDFLHKRGIFCKDMAAAEKPCGFMVKRCEMIFQKPARLEDELVVETEISELRGAGFDCLQTVKRSEETLVEMNLQIVCVTASGKPVRIPPDVRTKLVEIS